jgi:hypothetical protein
MSGPYFQKKSWPPFVYGGATYGFGHLDEYQVEVVDSKKAQRVIAITFSDHCFTRDPKPGDEPSLQYLSGSRRQTYFCADRYQYSLGIACHIDQATRGKVWNVREKGVDNSFAIVPSIDHHGVRVLYGIVFNLDPVKGLPVDLHMRVKTAYPCDRNTIDTFGFVDFSHLVTLRMQRKHPKLLYDKGRKRPRIA